MSPAARDLDQVFTPAELRERAIAFDRIDRREYIYPNLSAQTFDLFTLDPRELHGGIISAVGVDSPQFDWFGDEDYLFTTQRVQPIGQQLRSSDGDVASEIQFYSLRGVGSTENPTPVNIKLLQQYTWSLFVALKTGVPATGFAVVNLYVRTMGYLYR